MGVTGATSAFLSYEPKYVSLKDNEKKYIVVDAYSFLCRYVIGDLKTKTYITNKYGNKITEIYYLYILALRFLTNGIIPIFVFDGASPAVKSDTLDRRSVAKDKAIDNIHLMKSQEVPIDPDIYIKNLMKSFRLDKDNVEYAKLILRWMGLPVVDAAEESDSQCAAIAIEYADQVIGVLTDDFDPLMFGCTSILRLPSLGSNYLIQYSLDDTLFHLRQNILRVIKDSTDPLICNIKDDLVVTHDHLIEIGCLMGSDYCPGLIFRRSLKGSKFDSILELYIRNNFSLENVIDSMRRNLKPAYITKLLDARNAYKSAKIFDPGAMDITFKKPCIPMIWRICKEQSIISESDLSNALRLIDTAYSSTIEDSDSVSTCSGECDDHRPQLYDRNRHYPEPGHRTQIMF